MENGYVYPPDPVNGWDLDGTRSRRQKGKQSKQPKGLTDNEQKALRDGKNKWNKKDYNSAKLKQKQYNQKMSGQRNMQKRMNNTKNKPKGSGRGMGPPELWLIDLFFPFQLFQPKTGPLS